MTDTMFTHTALTEAAKKAVVTTDQARTILEAAGVKVQPEKPALPTDPESVIIATEVRAETGKWRMLLGSDGDWASADPISGRHWHKPDHITAWAEARIVPVTATPVTLTEDQVGEVWDKDSLPLVAWRVLGSRNRERITATVNTFLTQHAAPAEDMPDRDDVRNAVASQRGNGWALSYDAINGITDAVMRLLHREDQP